jgi:hypothetical protein
MEAGASGRWQARFVVAWHDRARLHAHLRGRDVPMRRTFPTHSSLAIVVLLAALVLTACGKTRDKDVVATAPRDVDAPTVADTVGDTTQDIDTVGETTGDTTGDVGLGDGRELLSDDFGDKGSGWYPGEGVQYTSYGTLEIAVNAHDGQFVTSHDKLSAVDNVRVTVRQVFSGGQDLQAGVVCGATSDVDYFFSVDTDGEWAITVERGAKAERLEIVASGHSDAIHTDPTPIDFDVECAGGELVFAVNDEELGRTHVDDFPTGGQVQLKVRSGPKGEGLVTYDDFTAWELEPDDA